MTSVLKADSNPNELLSCCSAVNLNSMSTMKECISVRQFARLVAGSKPCRIVSMEGCPFSMGSRQWSSLTYRSFQSFCSDIS
jgi:hypothetical protein